MSPVPQAMTGATAPSGNSISISRILWLEVRTECLRLLRTPGFVIPTIALPIMFYLLFGVMLGARYGSGSLMAAQLLARFLSFGIIAPGLFGLGVTLAVDRERGLLELKRALPMPSGIYLAAKLIVAALLAMLIATLLISLAVTIGQVVLTPMQWLALFALAPFGVLPFCAIGLLIGTLVKGSAAPATINLIYLPMSFLSGVLLPLAALPHGLAQLAAFWPAYHLAQLAGDIAANKSFFDVSHLAILALTAALCFSIASRRLRKRS